MQARNLNGVGYQPGKVKNILFTEWNLVVPVQGMT